eukprot:15175581-Alexandrium_andersonii.AAC.1
MSASLVGSEMCIRDSSIPIESVPNVPRIRAEFASGLKPFARARALNPALAPERAPAQGPC